MSGFTKLFSSIVTSTIWCEDHPTVRVWIAMLAMSDARGKVEGSVPGFARLSNVTIPEMEKALAIFMAPDPHSRTPENEGRRIEPIAGGWRILNYAAYRESRDPEVRRVQNLEAQRRHRAASANVSQKSAQAEADAEADKSKVRTDAPEVPGAAPVPAPFQAEGPKTPDTTPPASPPRGPAAPPLPLAPDAAVLTPQKSAVAILERQAFAESFGKFWAAYPRKTAKAKAEAAWRKIKPSADLQATILAALGVQKASEQWARDGGQFIPHPATWLNGRRWEDEAPAAAPKPGEPGYTVENVDRVVAGYRDAKGIPKTDQEFRLVLWPKHKAPARDLLEYFRGDWRAAVDCIAYTADKCRGMDWGWTAIMGRAPEFKNGGKSA